MKTFSEKDFVKLLGLQILVLFLLWFAWEKYQEVVADRREAWQNFALKNGCLITQKAITEQLSPRWVVWECRNGSLHKTPSHYSYTGH